MVRGDVSTIDEEQRCTQSCCSRDELRCSSCGCLFDDGSRARRPCCRPESSAAAAAAEALSDSLTER
jgi:hypothetical protein